MNQEQESPSLMNRTACGERMKLWGACQPSLYLLTKSLLPTPHHPIPMPPAPMGVAPGVTPEISAYPGDFACI
jgi:hypothetical protein